MPDWVIGLSKVDKTFPSPKNSNVTYTAPTETGEAETVPESQARGGAALAGGAAAAVPRVGRNDPCPCGSGKKYKHCHGALA